MPGLKPVWSGTVIQEVSRRYLAVFLPLLPSERIKRSRLTTGKPPDAPFALVEKVRGAMRLAALDSAALALGLTDRKSVV